MLSLSSKKERRMRKRSLAMFWGKIGVCVTGSFDNEVFSSVEAHSNHNCDKLDDFASVGHALLLNLKTKLEDKQHFNKVNSYLPVL